MSKPDFPPLLAAGKHVLTLPEFEALAVSPFPTDAARQRLFALFTVWIGKLQALQVKGIVWIDGSFLTSKMGPGDIDCVLWNPQGPTDILQVYPEDVANLVDKNHVQAQFGLDFYLEVTDANQLFHRESYWMGVFGFQHDRSTAKGFVELSI